MRTGFLSTSLGDIAQFKKFISMIGGSSYLDYRLTLVSFINVAAVFTFLSATTAFFNWPRRLGLIYNALSNFRGGFKNESSEKFYTVRSSVTVSVFCLSDI